VSAPGLAFQYKRLARSAERSRVQTSSTRDWPEGDLAVVLADQTRALRNEKIFSRSPCHKRSPRPGGDLARRSERIPVISAPDMNGAGLHDIGRDRRFPTDRTGRSTIGRSVDEAAYGPDRSGQKQGRSMAARSDLTRARYLMLLPTRVVGATEGSFGYCGCEQPA